MTRNRQLDRVREAMSDGNWHSLRELADLVGCLETSVGCWAISSSKCHHTPRQCAEASAFLGLDTLDANTAAAGGALGEVMWFLEAYVVLSIAIFALFMAVVSRK